MAETGPVRSISAPGIKIDGELLYNMRREVANLLDRKNLGFPGAQPVSFARKHLVELTKADYYVCEKSDGMRYLLYLTSDEKGDEIQYLIDRKNDYWWVPPNGLHFPVPQNLTGFHVNTIVDGELVVDKLPNGQTQPKYLVFDCMVIDGNSLMNRTLDKRIAYFKERVFDPYSQLLKEYPQEIQYMHFIVELKQMQFSYAVEMMFRQILPSLPHGNDGLIFTCRSTDYKPGTDQHILKWKPEHENSIDFKLSLEFPFIEPDEHDKKEGLTEAYLDYDSKPVCNLLVYAGDSQEDPWFGIMHLEDEEWDSLKGLGEPLDERIVECFMDDHKRWRYMRFRDDKKQANHTSTVSSVIESITDRVTSDDLIVGAKAMRDEWKRRAAEEEAKHKAERKRMASTGTSSASVNAGAKRKPEEQAAGGSGR